MTPEEQAARAIIEARCDHDGSWYNCDYCLGTERLIVAALRQARREEREACARVAESWYELPDEVTDMPGSPTIEKIIGNAIRRARADEREG